MAVIDRVRELVVDAVLAADAELYDIEFNGGVLRLLLQREGGIDITVIKRVSRDVSRLLDEADPIPGRYTLEVSSPGLERPLRTPEHYQGALGEQVKIKTFAEVDGRRRFEGAVLDVHSESVEIDTADGVVDLPLDQISKARTVFVWEPTPKPGGPKNRSTSSDRSENPDRPTEEATAS